MMHLSIACILSVILLTVDGKQKQMKSGHPVNRFLEKFKDKKHGHQDSKYSSSSESSEEDACSSNPCLNGGKCTIGVHMEAVCSCTVGYTGTFCDGNVCSSATCHNGGTCTVGANGQPLCSCVNGFSGPFCDSVASCPQGYQQLTTTGCYKIITTQALDYATALDLCIGEGSILFEPNDQAELDAVSTQLVNIAVSTNTRRSYWIGVNDQTTEGNVVYSSSSAPFNLVDLSVYNNEQWDCAVLVSSGTGNAYFVAMTDCAYVQSIVCEFKLAK